MFLVSCGGAGVTSGAPSIDAPAADYREGQIIDTATGQILSPAELTARLLQQEIIYLGEEHHNRFHVAIAVAVLQYLMTEARRPVLAMEMFAWDVQAALDRLLAGPDLPREQWLEEIRWRHNWGGAFEDYEPLVQYARHHRLSLVALNPPKQLVRTVAKTGLEQARRDPEMIRWAMHTEPIVDDHAYRERILQHLRACHDGGTDAMYQTMYEASMVRDEGMARTIASLVQRLRAENDPFAGPVGSYTGGGHVQYNLPVPKRVARRLADPVRQASIYLTAYEASRIEEVRAAVREKIADYVWLTPVGAQGPPRRCR